MNQMVCFSSFAPFSSLSPSPSKSPFVSRQSLCLVCNMFPQSKSQPHRITTSTNFLSNINFDDYFGKTGKARRGCGKADAISGQEGEAGEEEGRVPHVIFYNTLIAGLCKKGEIDKAVDILHDMISKECEPDVITYTTLIDGLCKKRDIDFVDWYMIFNGHEPKDVIYKILVHGLLREGEIEKAADVLDIMISKGLEPNGQKGEIEEAKSKSLTAFLERWAVREDLIALI